MVSRLAEVFFKRGGGTAGHLKPTKVVVTGTVAGFSMSEAPLWQTTTWPAIFLSPALELLLEVYVFPAPPPPPPPLSWCIGGETVLFFRITSLSTVGLAGFLRPPSVPKGATLSLSFDSVLLDPWCGAGSMPSPLRPLSSFVSSEAWVVEEWAEFETVAAAAVVVGDELSAWRRGDFMRNVNMALDDLFSGEDGGVESSLREEVRVEERGDDTRRVVVVVVEVLSTVELVSELEPELTIRLVSMFCETGSIVELVSAVGMELGGCSGSTAIAGSSRRGLIVIIRWLSF